jgi:hypothetical protein
VKLSDEFIKHAGCVVIPKGPVAADRALAAILVPVEKVDREGPALSARALSNPGRSGSSSARVAPSQYPASDGAMYRSMFWRRKSRRSAQRLLGNAGRDRLPDRHSQTTGFGIAAAG